MRVHSFFSFLLLAIFAMPSYAALNSALPAGDFARDFAANGSESHSFSRGKTASFYKVLDDQGYGFNVKGVLGGNDRAASLSSGLNQGDSGMLDLEKKAKLTTLMVNGSYDLKRNLSEKLPMRPYVTGGVGLALYDTSHLPQPSSTVPASTAMIPVVHVGAGVAYKMGQDWDLALGYKAGFAGSRSAVDGGTQQANIQLVDVNFKYKF